MKLQLDTENKTIKLENVVNVKELIDILKKLLPNGEWKNFTLETNVAIYWSNLIYIEPYKIHPTYPWYGTTGTVKYDNNNNSDITNINQNVPYTLTEGLYNIEII